MSRRLLAYAALLPAVFLSNIVAQDIVLEHATLIDGTGAPPRKDVTVVIADGRILSIGASVKPAPGATVVDATGQFLIPGLWDMHFHLDPQGTSLHTLASKGITGIREMYSQIPIATLAGW